MDEQPNFPEQLVNETDKAYVAFCKYCLLGADRSLVKLHQNNTKTTPGRLRWIKEWSRINNWQERVKSFDAGYQHIDLTEYEEERRKSRKDRVQLLRAAYGKLAQALKVVDPTTAKYSEIMAGIKMVVQELRSEFDDEPKQRHEHSGVITWKELMTEAAEAYPGDDDPWGDGAGMNGEDD